MYIQITMKNGPDILNMYFTGKLADLIFNVDMMFLGYLKQT